MKLSSETLEIIDSIIRINGSSPIQGACFQAGDIIKARKNKAAMPIMKAKIEEEFPRDFAIYNLKKFISMFKLLEEPELTFLDTHVEFKSGRKKASIRYAKPELIEDQSFYSKEVQMPSRDIVFDLSTENFASIKSAASSFEAPEIAIIGKDGAITLSTYNSLNPGNDAFTIDVGETEHEFTLIMAVEHLVFPKREYKVTASLKKIVEFNSDQLTYWFTCSDKSKV